MTDDTLDFIRYAEKSVTEFILADERQWFSNVPVLQGHRSDLATMVEKALAEAVGVCVVVELTDGKVPDIGDVEDANLSVIVSESPVTNRSGDATGKTAPGAVHELIRILRAGAPARALTWKLLASRDGVVYEITAACPVAININPQTEE